MDGSKINPISVARRGQQAGQINDIAERNGRTKVIIIINGTKKKSWDCEQERCSRRIEASASHL